ncbi:hypothetical protein Q9R08_05035 [Microbacterium sp. QXD-8]|uniref:SRCR domain-containing protein n=1 Tax=Microbacterium psychrotolerans TaxID=3068321 RepID=A0ABU0YYB6_9MICO|nr:hypothetical protein [Microbacterium sp. QXD-8]MDQ7877337.1 hypothetical protein [Microbacterium sp. QXD-8]
MSMSTSDQQVLEALDFPATCVITTRAGGTDALCTKPATHTATCRECGGWVAYLCDGHASWIRLNTSITKHRKCGTTGPRYALIEVQVL